MPLLGLPGLPISGAPSRTYAAEVASPPQIRRGREAVVSTPEVLAFEPVVAGLQRPPPWVPCRPRPVVLPTRTTAPGVDPSGGTGPGRGRLSCLCRVATRAPTRPPPACAPICPHLVRSRATLEMPGVRQPESFLEGLRAVFLYDGLDTKELIDGRVAFVGRSGAWFREEVLLSLLEQLGMAHPSRVPHEPARSHSSNDGLDTKQPFMPEMAFSLLWPSFDTHPSAGCPFSASAWRSRASRAGQGRQKSPSGPCG
jgi:hypothetical protein